MRYFELYGLAVASDVPLALNEGHDVGDADIVIAHTTIPEAEVPSEDQHYFTYDGTTIHVRYPDVATCRITRGEIGVDPDEDVDDAVLTRYLVGPALAAALHLRGWLVLHASGAVVDGNAVLYLGESGRGKSTLAAWGPAAGHELLTDDVAAVRPTEAGAVVEPGPSFIKLNVDTALILGGSWDRVYGEDTDLPKPHYTLSEHISRESKPLKRIYVLEEGAETTIERLDHRKAFRELVRNTYVRSFLDHVGQASHLHQCAAVVNSVPVCRLRRPLKLTNMTAVYDVIEDDLYSRA